MPSWQRISINNFQAAAPIANSAATETQVMVSNPVSVPGGGPGDVLVLASWVVQNPTGTTSYTHRCRRGTTSGAPLLDQWALDSTTGAVPAGLALKTWMWIDTGVELAGAQYRISTQAVGATASDGFYTPGILAVFIID